jgi:hypothetical protein
MADKNSTARRHIMASKQYGLKVVYEPSNTVEREEWFNTESERNSAMAGSTLDPHYMFVAAEKEVESAVDAKPEKQDPV